MTAWRFLFISLVLHILVAALLQYEAENRKTPPSPVEITIFDPKDQESQKQRTVVTQAQPSINSLKPKDPKFFSTEDQSVEKETRARLSGATKNKISMSQLKPNPAPNSEQSSSENEVKPSTPSPFGTQVNRRAPKETKRLKQMGANLFEASTNGEYLPDISDGPMTFLNTERFVYASFFTRIEERVRSLWERELRTAVDRLTAQQVNHLGDQDWVTGVEIFLDEEGNYLSAIVFKGSGIESLDAAAVEAFREARMIPNPPKAMIEKDGKVHLKIYFAFQQEQGLNPWARR